jgi:hypothetical protein
VLTKGLNSCTLYALTRSSIRQIVSGTTVRPSKVRIHFSYCCCCLISRGFVLQSTVAGHLSKLSNTFTHNVTTSCASRAVPVTSCLQRRRMNQAARKRSCCDAVTQTLDSGSLATGTTAGSILLLHNCAGSTTSTALYCFGPSVHKGASPGYVIIPTSWYCCYLGGRRDILSLLSP